MVLHFFSTFLFLGAALVYKILSAYFGGTQLDQQNRESLSTISAACSPFQRLLTFYLLMAGVPLAWCLGMSIPREQIVHRLFGNELWLLDF